MLLAQALLLVRQAIIERRWQQRFLCWVCGCLSAELGRLAPKTEKQPCCGLTGSHLRSSRVLRRTIPYNVVLSLLYKIGTHQKECAGLVDYKKIRRARPTVRYTTVLPLACAILFRKYPKRRRYRVTHARLEMCYSLPVIYVWHRSMPNSQK